MLPYKIRKPVYGGAKITTKSSSSSSPLFGNDEDDPLKYGGALQRAVLSDLTDLKTRYHSDLAQSSHSHHDTNASSSMHHHHAGPGAAFGIFKTTFRNARFGCIHARTVPSRVDKCEFAQLIYASCLHLLRRAVNENNVHRLDVYLNRDDNENDDDNNGSDALREANAVKSFLHEAVFAVFALYALHRTNTLPKDPYHAKVTYHHPSIRQQHEEQELQRQWSFLPLGKASGEGGGKIYRRHYKSPVRIHRECYLSLMLVRDVCAAIVTRCAYCSDGDERRFGNNSGNNNAIRHSHDDECYNLALDGVHVIDRMMNDNDFFAHCEYHGPTGLEGLAGNPNFYNAYYGNGNIDYGKGGKKTAGRKSKGKKQRETREPSQTLFRVLTGDRLQSIRNDCRTANDYSPDDELSLLLDRHKTNLGAIQTELRTNRRKEYDIGRSKQQRRQGQQQHPQNNHSNIHLKPRQRELVEKTLREIWIDGAENNDTTKPSYLDMTNKLSTSETGHVNDDADNDKELRADERGDLPHLQNQLLEAESSRPPIALPPSFSSPLCSNIREALLDFNEIVDSVRRNILEDRKKETSSRKDGPSVNVRNTEADGTCIDFSTFDADSTSPTKREYERAPSLVLYDEVSVSTGAGKKALSALLSASKQPTNNRQPLDDFWNLQADPTSTFEAESVAADIITANMSDDADELSVSIGPGKHALSALLSFSVYDDPSTAQHEKQNKKRKRTSSKRKTNISTHIDSDDSSFSDSVTDAGRHALQSLLGLASESAKRPKHSSKKDKKDKKASDKPSSVPSKRMTSSKKKLDSITKEKNSTMNIGEDCSLSVSSIEAGRHALGSLLGMAVGETSNSCP